VDRVLFEKITGWDLVYFGSAVLIGIVVALVVRFVTRRSKRKLRERTKTSLSAQLIDDFDGPLALWLVVIGIYLGLLRLPPLADHLEVLRRSFTVASIVVAVFAILRIQGRLIVWYTRRLGRRTGQVKVLNSFVPMAKRIVSIAVIVFGTLIVLDQLGVSIAPLIAGLGIGGLAVALALQGTLTNFFAGINVLTDGSMRVGDFVELDNGLRGEVDQIGWRTTRIRMLANNMVIIPNSKLADNVTTNYSHPVDELSVYIELGVSYFSDLDHVERVTVEVARQVIADTEGAVKGSEPSIWYTEFGDSNINFWAVLRANNYGDSWLVKHNFIKAIFRRYDEEGIEISFPARNVFTRTGPLESKPVSKPRQ
jgi:small-conductance mechanosensitive channel